MDNQSNKNRKLFQEIITKRRSWRKFTKDKISENIINEIIINAQHTPSSFGLEPWKVLIISDTNLKQQIFKYCFNQTQVIESSHLFVILSYKGHMFAEDNLWMKQRIKKIRQLNDEQYHKFYHELFLLFMNPIKSWDEWSIRQSYILLESLMLNATAYNLASCPMEGIGTNDIVNFLELNNIIRQEEHGHFNCPVILAVGHPDETYITREKAMLDDTFVII